MRSYLCWIIPNQVQNQLTLALHNLDNSVIFYGKGQQEGLCERERGGGLSILPMPCSFRDGRYEGRLAFCGSGIDRVA
jgi:hypothetical protein